jgi:hypothetical protein
MVGNKEAGEQASTTRRRVGRQDDERENTAVRKIRRLNDEFASSELQTMFCSLVVHPSLLSFRSTPSSSLSGSFRPFFSVVYLWLVIHPSLLLPFRSLLLTPSLQNTVCCATLDPETWSNRDRIVQGSYPSRSLLHE